MPMGGGGQRETCTLPMCSGCRLSNTPPPNLERAGKGSSQALECWSRRNRQVPAIQDPIREE